MAWESVKKHTRRLSDGMQFFRSPTKAIPPPVETDPHAPITMTLADVNVQFDESGVWTAVDRRDHAKMEAEIAELGEKARLLDGENQVLKFKLNVVMDMLAGAKLDVLKLQQELYIRKSGAK
ncbi:hypothetical protein BJ742DRAFT_772903 [Cladochytrium replicatum]|nr:hypothetical protein BJ742DRAFT_772903 [Cladochytrium replicatum]